MNLPSSLLIVSSTLFLFACGDSGSEDASQGSSTTTSYDATVSGGGGTPVALEQRFPNSEASAQVGGAVVADGTLTLYFTAQTGETLVAYLKTDETTPAPGRFAIDNVAPTPNSLTFAAPLVGKIYDATGGAIVLKSCPTALGGKLTGSFDAITLKNVADEADTRSLSGTFDLAVFAFSGPLTCQAPTGGDNGGGNSSSCGDYEACDGTADGACCPYMPCIAQCQLTCAMGSACISGDVAACAACSAACPTSCNVNAACKTAFAAADACYERSGCNAISDSDQQDACGQSHCCAEVKAAF